ncbi:MAG: hypothetical protein IPL53_12165 [Ignavibacteria bacterium]|nr:hypothetical protein [Ignavibacteria bacterium]
MKTKNLLAITFLLFSIAFISVSGFSQQSEKNNKTPEEFATKMADRMKKNLSLTDDQYRQVYNLALTKARNRDANKEKYKNLDKETRKQMKMQSRDEFKKQLQGILNAEQIKKMEENMSKHKNHKGNKKHKKSE